MRFVVISGDSHSGAQTVRFVNAESEARVHRRILTLRDVGTFLLRCYSGEVTNDVAHLCGCMVPVRDKNDDFMPRDQFSRWSRATEEHLPAYINLTREECADFVPDTAVDDFKPDADDKVVLLRLLGLLDDASISNIFNYFHTPGSGAQQGEQGDDWTWTTVKECPADVKEETLGPVAGIAELNAVRKQFLADRLLRIKARKEARAARLPTVVDPSLVAEWRAIAAAATAAKKKGVFVNFETKQVFIDGKEASLCRR